MGTKKLEYWQRDSYLKKKALAKTDIQKSVLRQGIDIGRKQTLEEVRKDLVHYEFEFSGASQEWIALYGFRKKLEQKIKEAK